MPDAVAPGLDGLLDDLHPQEVVGQVVPGRQAVAVEEGPIIIIIIIIIIQFITKARRVREVT